MSKKKRNHERGEDLEESESQDGAANIDQFEEVLDSVMYEVPRNLSLILEGNVKINEEWSLMEQLKLQLEEDSLDLSSHLKQMVSLLINISQVYDEKLSCVDHIYSCVEDLAETQRKGQQQQPAGGCPSKMAATQETTSEHKMMLRRREDHSSAAMAHHHYTPPPSSLTDYFSDSKRRKKDTKFEVEEIPHSKSYLTRSKYDKLRRQSDRLSFPSPTHYSETDIQSIHLSEHSDQDGDGEDSDEPIPSRTKPSEPEPIVQLYCICRKNLPEAAMVACDNQHCEIEWFHFKCVELKVEPKGKWYCPACRINKHTYNKPKPKLKRK